MRRIGSAAAAVAMWVALLGCKDHDDLKVDVVCADICRCAEPDEVAECEAECPTEVEPEDISEACFQCFLDEDASAAGAACTRLRDRCYPICDDTQPPEDLP